MDNDDDISYIIQITDNASEYPKSNISENENLTIESLYQFLASDLTVALHVVRNALLSKDLRNSLFMKTFIKEIIENSIPLIYKMKLMTGIEITSIMVVDVLNEMIEVLEKLSTSKISFSTEIELISIFQMIFTKSLFESEVFCVIATIIYRSIKETALLWSHIQYLFFIHIYLLQFGIYFVTSKGLRIASNQTVSYKSFRDNWE